MDSIPTQWLYEQGPVILLMTVVFVASYKRVWGWYSDFDQRVADLTKSYETQLAIAKERLEESKKDKLWWQAQATRAMGVAEGTVQQQLKSGGSDVS